MKEKTQYKYISRRALLLTLFLLGCFLCILSPFVRPYFDEFSCVSAAPTSPPPLSISLQTENQTMYVGVSNGDFYAMNTENGQRLWQSKLSSRFALTSDLLIGTVLTSQGELFTALQKQDGHTRWQIPAAPSDQSWIGGPFQNRIDSFLISENTAYMVQTSEQGDSSTHQFQAIRLSDGKVLWTRSSSYLEFSLLGVDPQALYVYDFMDAGDNKKYIQALSTVDGHPLWSVPTEYNLFLTSSWSSAVNSFQQLSRQDQAFYVAYEHLIYVKTPQELFALDTRTGRKVWRQPNTSSIKLWTLEVSGDGQIFLLSGESLISLQASNGTLRWRFPFKTNPLFLQVTDNLLYVLAQDESSRDSSGSFYALQSTDGKLLWNKNLNLESYGEEGMLPIVSTKDAVYLLNSTGRSWPKDKEILALSSVDGHELWRKANASAYPALRVGGTLYGIESRSGWYCSSMYNHARFSYALQALDASNGKTLWTFQQHVVAPTK